MLKAELARETAALEAHSRGASSRAKQVLPCTISLIRAASEHAAVWRCEVLSSAYSAMQAEMEIIQNKIAREETALEKLEGQYSSMQYVLSLHHCGQRSCKLCCARPAHTSRDRTSPRIAGCILMGQCTL